MQFCNNAWRSLEGDEGLYQLWSTLVEGGNERYRPPGKLTLKLVLANQNKINFMFMDYPAYKVGR